MARRFIHGFNAVLKVLDVHLLHLMWLRAT